MSSSDRNVDIFNPELTITVGLAPLNSFLRELAQSEKHLVFKC